MSIIKVLPENLVNQIAAGEVVERPASVVKELTENSLDAGADKIVIEIKDGGKTLIKISDNGCGMERSDCELALRRHATSKLLNESGLWNIKTMGFRGEALASISSVSQLTLKSRRREDVSGTEIACYGGEIKTLSDIGMSPGTQIEVRNLFFNTPARQKYLRKESTELSHISNVITSMALANPGIHFELIHNGKSVLNLPKTTDLISRVADTFGEATAQAMLPIFYGASNLKMDGFIGKPVLSRSTNQHQYIFVNKRPIQHFLIANTIKEAFRSLLMEGKKPVFILNIQIDPALIDVNVHPRKLEIRFEDQQTILSTIYNSVKKSLEKENLAPKAFTEASRYMSDSFPKSSQASFPQQKSVEDALDFSKNFLAEREYKPLQNFAESEKTLSIKPLSQVSNSYIVAQDGDKIILIDQHAAHERIRYEQLMDQLEKDKKQVQPLLMPIQLELSASEKQLLTDNKSILTDLGFEIENFGGNSFSVSAVPGFLSKEDPENIVKGVLDDLLNEKSPSKLQGQKEAIINYMACRSAIKFGQKLAMDEMYGLVAQLEKLSRPYTCPHGRPTMISLTLSELEKMFGRK